MRENPVWRESIEVYFGEGYGFAVYFYLLIILAPVEFLALYIPSLDAQRWSGSASLFKVSAVTALLLVVYFALRVANQEFAPWRFKSLKIWLRDHGLTIAAIRRAQVNFLFTHIPDAEHNQFNLLISTVAAVEIAVLLLAMWGSRRERSLDKKRWLLLTCWGGAAALIMISITNPLWQHLLKLRFVQLPWRWLLCLNAVLALMFAMATRWWTSRVVAVGVLLGAVLVAGYRIQAPWWDTAADITEMVKPIERWAGVTIR